MYAVDLPPGVSGEKVRESVLRLRDAPNALGALVTTHKLAVWKEAADLFSEVDEHASRLQEISCISRNKDGQLIGHAKDFITSAKALNLLLPQDHWQNYPEAETLVMGCGGAGTAIIEQLTLGQNGTFPKRVTGLEFNTHRLETVCKQFGSQKNLILVPADKEGITAVKKNNRTSSTQPGSKCYWDGKGPPGFTRAEWCGFSSTRICLGTQLPGQPRIFPPGTCAAGIPTAHRSQRLELFPPRLGFGHGGSVSS